MMMTQPERCSRRWQRAKPERGWLSTTAWAALPSAAQERLLAMVPAPVSCVTVYEASLGAGHLTAASSRRARRSKRFARQVDRGFRSDLQYTQQWPTRTPSSPREQTHHPVHFARRHPWYADTWPNTGQRPYLEKFPGVAADRKRARRNPQPWTPFGPRVCSTCLMNSTEPSYGVWRARSSRM